MNKIYPYTLLFTIIIHSNAICQSLYNSLNSNTISGSQVIATVDSIQVTADEFFYSYEFGPAFTKRNNKSKEIHLDFMINEKLLTLQAFDKKIFEDEEVKSLFQDIQSDIATEELYKDSILSKVSMNDKELLRTMNEKTIEIGLKWIFSKSKNEIDVIYDLLNKGLSFDSLLSQQLNDTVFLDDRSLKTNLFNLRKKNPVLAGICDTLNVDQITNPFEIDNEWYIVKMTDSHQAIIITESEKNKLRKESMEFLTKSKMDSISDDYIHSLFIDNEPIIKRTAFNIARSYIGKFRLKKETYAEWKLEEILENALSSIGLGKSSNSDNIVLVEMKGKEIYLEKFITWFRNRNLYIKLPDSNLMEFSKSLENLVWLMIRDQLLIEIAEKNEYYNNQWVQKQSSWWKEKIAYSAYRNDILNSIEINKELNVKEEDSAHELTKRIFREIQTLRKKYVIKIDYDALNQINVSTENDKNAIEFYAAKNKGLIPRPPYPTIDNDWRNWN